MHYLFLLGYNDRYVNILSQLIRDNKTQECDLALHTIYNAVAPHYNVADQFGALSKSHDIAIDQILNTSLRQRAALNILDLGVGTGTFLQKLHEFIPSAHLTGFDISKEMLSEAQKNIDFTAIEASATEAERYLPLHSQDLILAHFINAYIPIDTLFQTACFLAKANGYFSFITTTYESFPVAQNILAEFISKDSLVSRVVGHYYKTIVKNTTVASGYNELTEAFKSHHFEIVAHERLSIPITLNDVNELITFGIDGTWFLNAMNIRMLPKNFLIARLKRIFSHVFTFPYHDTHVIDVILAKK